MLVWIVLLAIFYKYFSLVHFWVFLLILVCIAEFWAVYCQSSALNTVGTISTMSTVWYVLLNLARKWGTMILILLIADGQRLGYIQHFLILCA